MTFPPSNTPDGEPSNPFATPSGSGTPASGSPAAGSPPPYGSQPAYGSQPPYGSQGSEPQPGAGYPQPGGGVGGGYPQPGSGPAPYPGGGAYPAPAPYPGGGGFQDPYGQSTSKNSLGVWALVLGILGLVMCGFITGVAAIIVGMKGKAAADQGLANNRGMSVAGIVLGWVSTILTIVGVVIVIIAIASGDFDTSWNTY